MEVTGRRRRIEPTPHLQPVGPVPVQHSTAALQYCTAVLTPDSWGQLVGCLACLGNRAPRQIMAVAPSSVGQPSYPWIWAFAFDLSKSTLWEMDTEHKATQVQSTFIIDIKYQLAICYYDQNQHIITSSFALSIISWFISWQIKIVDANCTFQMLHGIWYWSDWWQTHEWHDPSERSGKKHLKMILMSSKAAPRSFNWLLPPFDQWAQSDKSNRATATATTTHKFVFSVSCILVL